MVLISSRTFSLVLILFLAEIAQAQSPDGCGLQVTQYGKYTVLRNDDVLIFGSGMTIDADGSPRAYHPDNNSGLDDLSNAGEPGHWDALATVDGEPILQGENDPAPSYFVSMTSLEDHSFPHTSPSHYVNSEEVPYIALPADLPGPRLGDVAFVVNNRKRRSSAAIFADQSPSAKLGEGSIALAKRIGIEANARWGGSDSGITYVVFLHSGQHAPLPVSQIEALARDHWKESELDRVFGCAVPDAATSHSPL